MLRCTSATVTMRHIVAHRAPPTERTRIVSTYYRKPKPPRNLTNDEREAWWHAIEERYGARLYHVSDIYADPRTGRVMAGSEYVARLGRTNWPEDATEWTSHVHTLNYGRGR